MDGGVLLEGSVYSKTWRGKPTKKRLLLTAESLHVYSSEARDTGSRDHAPQPIVSFDLTETEVCVGEEEDGADSMDFYLGLTSPRVSCKFYAASMDERDTWYGAIMEMISVSLLGDMDRDKLHRELCGVADNSTRTRALTLRSIMSTQTQFEPIDDTADGTNAGSMRLSSQFPSSVKVCDVPCSGKAPFTRDRLRRSYKYNVTRRTMQNNLAQPQCCMYRRIVNCP